ncbi:MAG: hypothetical protein HC876_22365, partial [Chloroflexaceae bacterium]|nr:hypothetical protein [Chloroflexaceae bacterium]
RRHLLRRRLPRFQRRAVCSPAGRREAATLVLLFLYIFGIGKAAVMPVHRWLPAAMVAPTPVSALLHAVAVVKAGVFTVVKVIVYVFGYETLAAVPGTQWLSYLAGFTIVAASASRRGLRVLRDQLQRLRLAGPRRPARAPSSSTAWSRWSA